MLSFLKPCYIEIYGCLDLILNIISKTLHFQETTLQEINSPNKYHVLDLNVEKKIT